MDEYETFPPGTRVQFTGASKGTIFLIVVGGYVVEDGWHFHSSDRPMTSKDFHRV